MKKLILIFLAFYSYTSFSQTIEKRLGIDPVSGRSGYIFNDTVYSVPQVAAFYFNGYGNFVSLRDTVRSYFSVAKSPLSYSAGVFDFDTTTHHSYGYYQTIFGSGGTSSLSGLTAATATNNIFNTNYKQTWNWNTLAADTALLLKSVNTGTGTAANNQILFGAMLSGANSHASDTTTTVLFSNKHTGGSSVNYAAKFIASGGLVNTAAIFEGSNADGSIRVGSVGQAGSVLFTRGTSSASPAFIGWNGPTESNVFKIENLSGGGEIRLSATSSSGFISFYTNGSEATRFSNNGIPNLSIGLTSTPTAYLNLKGGTSSIPQISFGNGTLKTVPLNGSMEYGLGAFYQTNSGSLRYALGGSVADFYTDKSDTSTTETDLYSYTFPTGAVQTSGAKISATYGGTFSDATATVQLKIYFGGTASGNIIANTGTLTLSGTGSWEAKVSVIMTTTASARCIVTINTPTATPTTQTFYNEVSAGVSGAAVVNPTLLKITGQAGGAGGGTGDITAKMGSIYFHAPANN